MTIPTKLRGSVIQLVLKNLEQYFAEAENLEDDIKDTVQDRLQDFYMYQYHATNPKSIADHLRPEDYKTDNRDTNETWVILPGEQIVEVHPFDLARNVAENLPDEISDKFVKAVTDLEQQIHTELLAL